MAGIDSGRLNRRLTIQEETRQSNGQGGFTTSWSDVKTVWAEVVGLSGDEALAAGIERSVQQWRITIRRRPVTTKNRLIGKSTMFLGRIFNVKSVMPDPKADDATLLICETVAGASVA